MHTITVIACSNLRLGKLSQQSRRAAVIIRHRETDFNLGVLGKDKGGKT